MDITTAQKNLNGVPSANILVEDFTLCIHETTQDCCVTKPRNGLDYPRQSAVSYFDKITQNRDFCNFSTIHNKVDLKFGKKDVPI